MKKELLQEVLAATAKRFRGRVRCKCTAVHFTRSDPDYELLCRVVSPHAAAQMYKDHGDNDIPAIPVPGGHAVVGCYCGRALVAAEMAMAFGEERLHQLLLRAALFGYD